jgi:hypothetical protein
VELSSFTPYSFQTKGPFRLYLVLCRRPFKVRDTWRTRHGRKKDMIFETGALKRKVIRFDGEYVLYVDCFVYSR